MGTEGAENIPNSSESFIVVEDVGRLLASGDRNGQHDVAVGFPGCFAHDAPDCLNDVNVRVAWTHEKDGIQRGNINTLREASGIREDTAGAVRIAFQPFNSVFSLECVVLSVNVFGFDAEVLRTLVFGHPFHRTFNHPVPMVHEAL